MNSTKQEILDREEQRKQAYFAQLGKQIDRVLPKLIAKANKRSEKGKFVHAEAVIHPAYGEITYDQHPYNKKGKPETAAWIKDEANRRLEAAGLPYVAGFNHSTSVMFMTFRNKLFIELPS